MTRAPLAPHATMLEQAVDPDVSAYPSDFVWGAATSAYQIDGAVDEGGRGPSIWDTFAHTPGMIAGGDTGDIACDHYHRWAEDLGLITALGLSGYRLSVSWPRLQPDGRGPLNPQGVAFYRKLLEALREAGVRPFVTLYHWELPQALEDAGGWPSARYRLVVRGLRGTDGRGARRPCRRLDHPQRALVPGIPRL